MQEGSALRCNTFYSVVCIMCVLCVDTSACMHLEGICFCIGTGKGVISTGDPHLYSFSLIYLNLPEQNCCTVPAVKSRGEKRGVHKNIDMFSVHSL